MPVPKFSNEILATAVAIRRGQKKLADVPEKVRPAVQDALSRDSAIMTYLRGQNPPGAGPMSVKPTVRFVS